ncbi:MAG: cysteine peptidase family C39 domain-containing protein [Methanosarcinales archaeon]
MSTNIKVPHYKQNKDYTCVPACVRMVLEYHNHMISEEELEILMETDIWGTYAENMLNITSIGFDVRVLLSNYSELTSLIDSSLPCIVFLQTDSLSYWDVECSHAVVVVGFDDEHVFVNDPWFSDAPIKIPKNEFMTAWSKNEYLLIKIEK